MNTVTAWLVSAVLAATLAACGGGSRNTITTTQTTFTITATVTGLQTGQSVRILDNGVDGIIATADGALTFATPLAQGTSYAVTVGTQPTAQTCSVTNGTGTVGSTNVTNVQVNCGALLASYPVTVTVSGLQTGQSVNILDNSGDGIVATTNGVFTFATSVATGANYNVTVATQPSAQTCNVLNGMGTVGSAAVSNVQLNCGTFFPTYTIAATVNGLQTGQSVKILDNCGDGMTLTTNGLHPFATPLATGTVYAVTVGTQPTTQACHIINGTGAVGSANITNVQVNCASPYSNLYAYVANSIDHTISAYSIDTTTGVLIPMAGSPFSNAGTIIAAPTAITVNPAGTVAYTANTNDGTVSAYAINPNTGALSSGMPYLTGGQDPFSMAIDPTGKFAYVANIGVKNNGIGVTAFGIGAVGALTQLVGSPYSALPAGVVPTTVTVDPSGKFVLVANNDSTISVFTMDANTGALTPVASSPFAEGGTSPWSITADPSGNFIYIANAGGGVSAFGFDASTGALTPVTGSPVCSG